MAVLKFLAPKSPGDLLGEVAPHVHRARLNEACQVLSLSAHYRWYSIRRGGATHAFRESGNLASVMIKGRWSEQRTARVYLNDGLSRLAELVLPVAQASNLKALALSLRPNLPV